MLDPETKNRIGNCRDILVGKVPDPKSQVEQITFAMIYKFMDDMDSIAESLGGEIKFFKDNYSSYSWRKLMACKGAFDLFRLYEEAIRKMPENQNIPKTFRDIFRNAHVPYRDEETLRLFLKEINNFTYDNSERLGDAFEYLLSLLGIQSDAGQFRTPRHIIDFMVDIIQPQKNETILDPACGSSGFLISAYNYIRKDAENQNKELSSAEVKLLQDNIKGYDIAPDWVRLSLVNMYLHDIVEPQVFLYDTLTSEEKWGEHADVILANPPFMTPKGGIRPHNRFSIESKRAEVLFVDYIAEHLNAKGRAAIIVPEGIVFQTGSAYKKLRKMLIEKYLVAVISLPVGTFNPYSASTKSSILILDKTIAKRINEILFIKIENDGYNLGARRSPIDDNDLPAAKENAKAWLSAIRNGKTFDFEETKNLYTIGKDKIKESSDYGLRGEQYRIGDTLEANFPIVSLGEIADIEKGTSITKARAVAGDIPVIAGGQKPSYYHNQHNRTGKTITVSGSGASSGFVNFFDYPIFASDCSTIKPKDENVVNIVFLYQFLKSIQEDIYTLQKGSNILHVYPKDLANIKIPIPPIEFQAEIVNKIQSYQKIIDGSRLVIENYQSRIAIDSEWPLIELGKLTRMYQSKTIAKKDMLKEGPYKVYGANGVIGHLSEYSHESSEVLVGCRGSCGVLHFSAPKSWINGNAMVVSPLDERLDKNYLFYILKDIDMSLVISGSNQAQITKESLSPLKIPLPPIEIQQKIVNEMEKEQRIIDSAKEAITIFEEKINNAIGRIWSK